MSHVNTVPQQNDSLWGSEACRLNLPGFSVFFSGLSVSQKEDLVQEFNDFLCDLPVSGVHAASFGITQVSCVAYRLAVKPETPLVELEANGQYAPQIFREDHTLSIKGHNFVASFEDKGSGNSQASLGVVSEHELTELPVIENFLRVYAAHNSVNLAGAILHSAGLVFDEQAVLFVGYSNVGKTTLTRKAYDAGATVLSDDINLILPNKSGYDAYKVPFTGEFGRTLGQSEMNSAFPLRAIVLLEQSSHLFAEVVGPAFAISRLLAGSPFVNTNEKGVSLLFDVYTELTKTLPVVRLGISLEDSVEEIVDLINCVVKENER